MDKKPPRDGYGEAILELCKDKDNVIILDTDVAKSTRTVWVKDKYPEKFIDIGISEQDMVGVAAGLSSEGFVPFGAAYGVFLSGRAFDQIRTTVCYDKLNVKLIGAHAGISVGPDGATHQALEDMALMSVLPNMTLIAPCDSNEAKKATLAVYEHEGPCYIRFGREAIPQITDENTPFTIGKANVLAEGDDCTVFACGAMVYEALEARKQLLEQNVSISVINVHTIKPLDKETVLKYAKITKAAVVTQEHQETGGLNGVVSQLLSKEYPIRLGFVSINDTFGESGNPDELMEKYGLNHKNIIKAVLETISKK